MIKGAALAVCPLIIFMSFGLCADEDDALIETTQNESAAWYVSDFDRHLLKVARQGEESVLIESDGRYFATSKSGTSSQFIAVEGDEFVMAPDDHGSTSFTVLSIGADAVAVEYESRFYHSSFGKDKITIDTGTVKIEYRDVPVQME